MQLDKEQVRAPPLAPTAVSCISVMRAPPAHSLQVLRAARALLAHHKSRKEQAAKADLLDDAEHVMVILAFTKIPDGNPKPRVLCVPEAAAVAPRARGCARAQRRWLLRTQGAAAPHLQRRQRGVPVRQGATPAAPLEPARRLRGTHARASQDSDKANVEERLGAQGVTCVKKVIGLQRLREKHDSHSSRLLLLKSYDLFLADDRILPMLSKALGKVRAARSRPRARRPHRRMGPRRNSSRAAASPCRCA